MEGYLDAAAFIASKLPGLAQVTFDYYYRGKQPHQEDLDLRAILQIAAIKAACEDGSKYTVDYVQALSMKDKGPPGHIYAIPDSFSPSDPDKITRAVTQALLILKPEEMSESELPEPDCTGVSAEWNALRTEYCTQGKTSNRDTFAAMEKDLASDSVVLYFHGGAYYLGDPTTHRDLVWRFARSFNGKCYSVRYRLAPQNGFPAGLTDALAAYEYLVNPPAGSLHQAIHPSKIVLAGDSSGGGLALSLLITLLENRPTWEMPAGIVLLSPWADLTHCFPSTSNDADYLPKVQGVGSGHKRSDLWAADGSRRHFYCSNDMVMHPLISPIAYKSWEGAPPMLVHTGAEEKLRDEGRYLAQRAGESGVVVQYEEYRSQIHVFQMLFHHPSSSHSVQAMGAFVKKVTGNSNETLPSKRSLVTAQGDVRDLADDEIVHYTPEKVAPMMIQGKNKFTSQVKL